LLFDLETHLKQIALTFAFLIAAAALFAQEPPASSSAPPPAPPIPSGPGHAQWASTYAQARELAGPANKLVFVELTKPDCGQCKRMETLLYPAAQFEMMILRMVPVRLEVAGPEAAGLSARYGLNDAPSVLVVTPEGILVFRADGFDDALSFYTHLHNSLVDWDKLHARLLHEDETRDDPADQLALGRELLRRFAPEEALPRLERAARSSRAVPKTRHEAEGLLANVELALKKFDAARATVNAILVRSTDPDEREQAELFRAQISLAEGKPEEARRRYERFLKQHPKSRHREDVRAMLKRLATAPESK
jgi:hypothetical protein